MANELKVNLGLQVIDGTYKESYTSINYKSYTEIPNTSSGYIILNAANTTPITDTDIVKGSGLFLRNHSSNAASNCTAGLMSGGNYYSMITMEAGDAAFVYLNLVAGDNPYLKVENTAVLPIKIEYALFEEEAEIIDSSSSSSSEEYSSSSSSS